MGSRIRPSCQRILAVAPKCGFPPEARTPETGNESLHAGPTPTFGDERRILRSEEGFRPPRFDRSSGRTSLPAPEWQEPGEFRNRWNRQKPCQGACRGGILPDRCRSLLSPHGRRSRKALCHEDPSCHPGKRFHPHAGSGAGAVESTTPEDLQTGRREGREPRFGGPALRGDLPSPDRLPEDPRTAVFPGTCFSAIPRFTGP